MAEIENTEQLYPRPLSGAKVEHLPSALIPARAALIGRYVTLEPLDAARHAGDLFEASHGSEAAPRIWDYLPWGPWNSEDNLNATPQELPLSTQPLQEPPPLATAPRQQQPTPKIKQIAKGDPLPGMSALDRRRRELPH
jgi:hypothetical protein